MLHPPFVITIIGNMILVNNVIPWTLSTKEKNDSSFSRATYQSCLKRRKGMRFSGRIKQFFQKILHRLPKAIKHFQNLKRSKIFFRFKVISLPKICFFSSFWILLVLLLQDKGRCDINQKSDCSPLYCIDKIDCL